mmetsp:Transcript_54121/g.113142  ORF Transcript_54121/g.113142 Transcript_54121/m.113142 type:complete len:308 (+) Transcript_54121:209-1132(+)
MARKTRERAAIYPNQDTASLQLHEYRAGITPKDGHPSRHLQPLAQGWPRRGPVCALAHRLRPQLPQHAPHRRRLRHPVRRARLPHERGLLRVGGQDRRLRLQRQAHGDGAGGDAALVRAHGAGGLRRGAARRHGDRPQHAVVAAGDEVPHIRHPGRLSRGLQGRQPGAPRLRPGGEGGQDGAGLLHGGRVAAQRQRVRQGLLGRPAKPGGAHGHDDGQGHPGRQPGQGRPRDGGPVQRGVLAVGAGDAAGAALRGALLLLVPRQLLQRLLRLLQAHEVPPRLNPFRRPAGRPAVVLRLRSAAGRFRL